MLNIIVNPTGASGKTMKVLKEVEDYLNKHNIDYHTNISTSVESFEGITKKLTSDDAEIILIGGDGTLNVFINNVANFKGLKLGYLPCGSGNDFAKSLNISNDINKELDKIIQGRVNRTLDIGQVEFITQFDKDNKEINKFKMKLFNNACGIGFDAEVCEKADRKSAERIKKFLNVFGLGKLIYLTVATKLVFSIEKPDMKISLNGSDVYEYKNVWFAASMNNAYEGGGFKFGPNAISGDEEYELCVAHTLPTSSFFKIFPFAYSGKHVKFDGVNMHKANTIEIETTSPMWVEYDGEYDVKSNHIKIYFNENKLYMMN